MFAMLNDFCRGFVPKRPGAPALLIVLAALSASGAAQHSDNPSAHALASPSNAHNADHYYEPLPQETGALGLKLMLRRLHTTASLMQTTAHPDDEDGGMLTLEARGKGVSTLLMTLTRGEGGQNKLGSNLFDGLGVLRTLELLAADRYYGVEQRFSRVADFGYSKTPEETFQKWQGHDIALGDMVRVIRTFRPEVLVARFSGTDRDGHGHHQASEILTREAFHAAADPRQFPEQIKEGLETWQPKKFYIGNVCGFGANTCDANNYTLRLNTGTVDPVLGTSYVQFAMLGLRHQQSQGAANWTVDPGDRFTYYKLVDSLVDSPKDKEGHEQSFFDGLDETLPGLAHRLGNEEKQLPWLMSALADVQMRIDEADAAADKRPETAIEPLTAAAAALEKTILRLHQSNLSNHAKNVLLYPLEEKQGQLSTAIALASSVTLHVVVDAPVGSSPDDAFVAVPGTTFQVTAKLSGPQSPTSYPETVLTFPPGWSSTVLSRETTGNEAITHFKVNVPSAAELTRPYWHRNNPEKEALNIIDDARYQTLPFPPPPITASAAAPTIGRLSAICMVDYKDSAGAVVERPLAVAPAFSVILDPGELVLPAEDGPQSHVQVDVASNLDSKSLSETHHSAGPDKDRPDKDRQNKDRQNKDGTNKDGPNKDGPNKDGGILQIEAPKNWSVDPTKETLDFQDRGDQRRANFTVEPHNRSEGRTEIKAILKSGQASFAEGYSVVTRDDLGTFFYYQPALQRVSIVAVKTPKSLRVGYVMGAGDEIPTVLQQIGMDVTLIAPEKLASENLSQYQTIVLGIRAYDTQKDVTANNRRLLDFVQAGGRLVVQYNAAAGDFNAAKLTPYPATLSRDRVSVEEAPVKILDPTNKIFHSPNEITQKDFEGWVQERGLYFMSQWDPNFIPLLESHDPGEGEKKGGLLVAKYGQGTYIYTGYAFFRQLPAGVPGAVRLFVNLIGSR